MKVATLSVGEDHKAWENRISLGHEKRRRSASTVAGLVSKDMIEEEESTPEGIEECEPSQEEDEEGIMDDSPDSPRTPSQEATKDPKASVEVMKEKKRLVSASVSNGNKKMREMEKKMDDMGEILRQILEASKSSSSSSSSATKPQIMDESKDLGNNKNISSTNSNSLVPYKR